MADVEGGEADVGRKVRMNEYHNDALDNGNGNGKTEQLSNNDGPKSEKGPDTEKKEKPSKLKEIWGKIGLDPITLMMMFKGSVGPALAVALYQADGVSTH